jgi:dihydrofolate reductase
MNYKVFIATSVDGYIADENDSVDWLMKFEIPGGGDGGYHSFIKTVDAIVMGRKTYEKVMGFDIVWPYTLPVYVLTKTLKEVPKEMKSKIEFVDMSLDELEKHLEIKGHNNIYIDGGKLITSYLNEKRVAEVTITRMPILLGKGSPLFGNFESVVNLENGKVSDLGAGIFQVKYECRY